MTHSGRRCRRFLAHAASVPSCFSSPFPPSSAFQSISPGPQNEGPGAPTLGAPARQRSSTPERSGFVLSRHFPSWRVSRFTIDPVFSRAASCKLPVTISSPSFSHRAPRCGGPVIPVLHLAQTPPCLRGPRRHPEPLLCGFHDLPAFACRSGLYLRPSSESRSPFCRIVSAWMGIDSTGLVRRRDLRRGGEPRAQTSGTSSA